MNLKEIKELINLMNENSLNELEIEKEGMRVKLNRGRPFEVQEQPIVSVERSISQTEAQETTKESNKNTIEIKSPMVGTFYRAASPESQAYVEIGQNINPQDTVCIVEAMKLMNEIKAEVKGKVIEILVDNAEPVEFGQTLFIVES